MNGNKKTCDTNKNVTRMDVIIKAVYNSSLYFLFYCKSEKNKKYIYNHF